MSQYIENLKSVSKNQILAYTTQTFLWYNYFKKWYEENLKRFTFGEL